MRKIRIHKEWERRTRMREWRTGGEWCGTEDEARNGGRKGGREEESLHCHILLLLPFPLPSSHVFTIINHVFFWLFLSSLSCSYLFYYWFSLYSDKSFSIFFLLLPLSSTSARINLGFPFCLVCSSSPSFLLTSSLYTFS